MSPNPKHDLLEQVNEDYQRGARYGEKWATTTTTPKELERAGRANEVARRLGSFSSPLCCNAVWEFLDGITAPDGIRFDLEHRPDFTEGFFAGVTQVWYDSEEYQKQKEVR